MLSGSFSMANKLEPVRPSPGALRCGNDAHPRLPRLCSVTHIWTLKTCLISYPRGSLSFKTKVIQTTAWNGSSKSARVLPCFRTPLPPPFL